VVHSIDTILLSHTVSEIFQTFAGYDLDHLGSRDVIEHVTTELYCRYAT